MVTSARFRPNQMWRLTKAMAEMKCEHWTKRWNCSSCTKLALCTSWTHSLIAQSIRASKRNSVVVGSSPTQANFLQLLQKSFNGEYHIHYIYIYIYIYKYKYIIYMLYMLCVCVCVCVCVWCFNKVLKTIQGPPVTKMLNQKHLQRMVK